MAYQNTSLLFEVVDMSPYWPGRTLDFQIDSKDFLLYEFQREENLRFDEFNTQLDATVYLNGRFGLLAKRISTARALGRAATKLTC